MELTEKEKSMVLGLIKLAWDSGAVRSEEAAQELRVLKAKLSMKALPPPEEKKP